MAERGNNRDLRGEEVPRGYCDALFQFLVWAGDEHLIPPTDPVLAFIGELQRRSQAGQLTFADAAPYAEQLAAAVDLIIRMRGWDRGIYPARAKGTRKMVTARVDLTEPGHRRVDQG
jgi:hypothetical protein